MRSVELHSVELRSVELRSAELRSNSDLHPCNTFLVKKMVKKRYHRNEILGLVWDRMEVC